MGDETSRGALKSGTQTTVSGSALKVWTANPGANVLILQNTGATNNVRVGDDAVTATTGLQLRPGQVVAFSGEDVPTNDVYALAEESSSPVLAQEVS